MSSVWIKKDSWDKVWSAIHNIRVRMSFTVKEPCVSLSGQGTAARINIDLPAGRSGKLYNGPFAVSYLQDKKTLSVNAGYLNINGILCPVAKMEIREVKTGLLCLKAGMRENGELLEPEYIFGEVTADSYPICRVDINEESVVLEMFTVPPVIPFLYAKECPFAMT